MSRLISVSRPETGAVRCEHLVAQHDIAVFVQTEFELGICDNDTAAQGIIRAFFVKSDGVVAELGSVFFPFARECLFKMSNALLIGNILIVVADLSLCGRCIDGFRQFIGFFEPFRQADAAYSAVFLIACPAAACNISADNTFDGKHVQLLAHHAVSVKFRFPEKFRHIFYICGNHMIRQDILCHVKPELGHLCEHGSFFGNRVFQDNVKTADPVSRNQNQAVAVVIDFAYFSFFNRFHFVYLVCL